MRIALALLLMVGAAMAQERYVRDVSTDTNGVGSATFTDVAGTLDAVFVSTATAVTGTVVVAYSPLGLSAISLVTNAVVQAQAFYPAVYMTDAAGTALTNFPPKAYTLKRDDVTVSVTGAPASSAWRIVLMVK
jgi:flavoprotein